MYLDEMRPLGPFSLAYYADRHKNLLPKAHPPGFALLPVRGYVSRNRQGPPVAVLESGPPS